MTDTREEVSLDSLIKLFKSKDFEAYDEYKKDYFEDKKLRFLDMKSVNNIVAYKSFPRSGNTFLRKYIELITGVPTGSEMPLSITGAF
jgi:hypothetical protein